MASNKPLAFKLRLIKAERQRGPVPSWVIMRTMGRVRFSPKTRRNWRTRKLRA